MTPTKADREKARKVWDSLRPQDWFEEDVERIAKALADQREEIAATFDFKPSLALVSSDVAAAIRRGAE